MISTIKFKHYGKRIRDRNICIKAVYVILTAALRNSKALFRHMKQRGVPVILWVLNEEEEFMEAYEMYGDTVDGVMTDRPTKLIEFSRKMMSQ